MENKKKKIKEDKVEVEKTEGIDEKKEVKKTLDQHLQCPVKVCDFLHIF